MCRQMLNIVSVKTGLSVYVGACMHWIRENALDCSLGLVLYNLYESQLSSSVHFSTDNTAFLEAKKNETHMGFLLSKRRLLLGPFPSLVPFYFSL